MVNRQDRHRRIEGIAVEGQVFRITLNDQSRRGAALSDHFP